MAESLLAHLYSRIRGSQEDVATVSLQYIIASSETLNAAFNRFISSALALEIGTDISYSCQSVGENNERPDMSGIDRDGHEVILLEMKFYAGLTENQPNGYLERLIKENGKALAFVCPEQRRVSLWNKIKELCIAAGRELSDESGFRVNVDGITMALISWAEIIDILSRTATSSVPEALPDLAQLSGFCKMMDSSSFIPFSPEEFGPENARREERYYQVIDRLFDLMSTNKEIHASGRGMKASANRNGYIRYMKTDKYQIALIYSRKAWMSKSSVETPFWFYLDDDGWKQSDHLKARLNTIPENQREGFNYDIGIALHALTDAPLDDIAYNLMEQILRFIESLEKQSMIV